MTAKRRKLQRLPHAQITSEVHLSRAMDYLMLRAHQTGGVTQIGGHGDCGGASTLSETPFDIPNDVFEAMTDITVEASSELFFGCPGGPPKD
jgi:hypothetical protein